LFTNGDSGNWKYLLNSVRLNIHDNKKCAIINNFINDKLKIAIRDSSKYEGSKLMPVITCKTVFLIILKNTCIVMWRAIIYSLKAHKKSISYMKTDWKDGFNNKGNKISNEIN